MFFLVNMLLNERMFPCVDAPPGVKNKKLNAAARLMVAGIMSDAFIAITALVIGILGITGLMPGMPPAAAYSLIALSGLVIFPWIVMGAFSKGDVFKAAGLWVKAAFSSNPKWA